MKEESAEQDCLETLFCLSVLGNFWSQLCLIWFCLGKHNCLLSCLIWSSFMYMVLMRGLQVKKELVFFQARKLHFGLLLTTAFCRCAVETGLCRKVIEVEFTIRRCLFLTVSTYQFSQSTQGNMSPLLKMLGTVILCYKFEVWDVSW